MRGIPAALTIVMFGMVGLTSGCSGGSTGSGGPIADRTPASGAPASAAPAAAGWQPFDPPTRFDSSKGIDLPDGVVETNVLLHGPVAYAGMVDGLLRVDLQTGTEAALVRPTRPVFTFGGRLSVGLRSTPALAELAGRQVVVLPMLVTVPAVGTNPESREVDLIVADAATGEAVSVLPIDLDDDDTGTLYREDMQVRVVGVRGSLVVLATGERAALAVDLASGRVSWRQPDFQPTALIGDTVVGESPAGSHDKSEVVGFALANGKRAWTALPETVFLNLSEAGPNAVIATGDNDGGFFVLIRPDGSLADRSKGKYLGINCQYDAKATTVCFSEHVDFAFALDATSFKVLWSMPQEGSRRTVPKVTAAWHGVVYGRANDQAVILDARSGTDRQPAPDISPQVVNAYAGLHTTGATVTAYPAIG